MQQCLGLESTHTVGVCLPLLFASLRQNHYLGVYRMLDSLAYSPVWPHLKPRNLLHSRGGKVMCVSPWDPLILPHSTCPRSCQADRVMEMERLLKTHLRGTLRQGWDTLFGIPCIFSIHYHFWLCFCRQNTRTGNHRVEAGQTLLAKTPRDSVEECMFQLLKPG